MLERFVQDLGRFTGLRELELQPLYDEVFDEYEGCFWDTWDEAAVLHPSLLRHLPPQLECLKASEFYRVGLEPEVAAGTAAAGSAAAAAIGPVQLLPPGLTRLCISGAKSATLDAPLPGLADLTIESCKQISLAGRRLCMPQLTSLQLVGSPDVVPLEEVRLCCAAMPALARLTSSKGLTASDSFEALQHLTHLGLTGAGARAESSMALVHTVSPTLRSARLFARPEAFQALAAAGATQLVQLVRAHRLA